MSTYQIAQTIPLITEPLVRAGFYPSSEQALKHIVLDYIDRRIAGAQTQVRRFEKKHGQSFATYSQSLAGKATIADEDEWMEWESLLDMLESWRCVSTVPARGDCLTLGQCSTSPRTGDELSSSLS